MRTTISIPDEARSPSLDAERAGPEGLFSNRVKRVFPFQVLIREGEGGGLFRA